MPSLPCLVCGRLSKASRCPEHEKARGRFYGSAHRVLRRDMIRDHPWCAGCGHTVDPDTARCGDPTCRRCPLQLDHVAPIRGGRAPGDSRRQVLCRPCNRAKSDKEA